MNNPQLEIPLNNNQLEILKLFSRELDEVDLLEIKRLIVKCLGEKVTRMAAKEWEGNNWTQENMEKLLNSHNRTLCYPQSQ